MQRLVIWVNTFIPKDISGITKVIPKGPYASKTAIPLPKSARLHPFNTFKNRGTGYLTDQRGFSDAPGASSRVQSYAEVSLSPNIGVIRSGHRTSGTMQIDFDDGKQTNYADADLSKCAWTGPTKKQSIWLKTSQTHPQSKYPKFTTSPTNETYYMRASGAANDPLVAGAAYIDFGYDFKIDIFRKIIVGPMSFIVNGCSVEVSGIVDDFPAFEAYAQFNGVTKTLFKRPIPAGNGLFSLVGGANNKVSGVAKFT